MEAQNGVIGVKTMPEPRSRGEDGGQINFSIREIIERMERKLDGLRDDLSKKSAIEDFEDMRENLIALESRVAGLERTEPVKLKDRLEVLERKAEISEGVSNYRYWFLGIIFGQGLTTVLAIIGVAVAVLKK